MQFLIMITVLAYFLFAIASILDKHIVSNTSLNPVAYAFYSGFFQILYVLAFPFVVLAAPQINLNFPPLGIFLLAAFDGVVFVMALVALYKATDAGEISRVSPMIGVLVPIFTFFLSLIFLGETLALNQLGAFIFFILGGFLMSAKIDNKKFSYIKGTPIVILAGFLFALYYVIMKFLFTSAGFVEVFLIMQLGGFLGALLLLVSHENREAILQVQKHSRKKNEGKNHGAAVFFANKLFSAVGAILLNYAIALGSATIVNSLQAVQYAFVLLFSLVLSKRAPHILSEETHHKVVLQKGLALALTAIGVILIYE